MNKRFYFDLSTTKVIMLSFFLAALAGSVLLSLPVSSVGGKTIPYIEKLVLEV